MLSQKIMTLGVVLATGLAIEAADFAAEFQKARGLERKRNYEQAGEAFANLAETAPNDYGKDACLAAAAVNLGRLKRVDEALAMAASVRSKPTSILARMEILSANKRHKELVEAFQNEDLDAWPDRINYFGYRLRGEAKRVIGDKPGAVEDLRRSVELAGSDAMVKLEVMNTLAGLQRALDDDDGALATLRAAFTVYEEHPGWKGKWTYPQAILSAAAILRKRQDFEGALSLLDDYAKTREGKPRGPWDFLAIEARGDVMSDQGRSDEALALYEDAATINTHKAYMERVAKKIDELKKRMAESNGVAESKTEEAPQSGESKPPSQKTEETTP